MIEDVFPDESVRDWPELPLPLLNEQLGDTVRRVLGGLHEASGIIASERRDETHEDEVAVLEAAIRRADTAMQEVTHLAAEHDDQLLVEIHNTLFELWRCLEVEAAALRDGQPVDRSIVASLLSGLHRNGDAVWSAEVGLVTACVEWDVEPDGAWARVERVLDAS